MLRRTDDGKDDVWAEFKLSAREMAGNPPA